MKTILLCMCIIFAVLGTLISTTTAYTSYITPTLAPFDGTVVPAYTPTATFTPAPTVLFAYPEPENLGGEGLYPAPEEPQTESNESFANLIKSIFGINHNGKNVQHK